MSRRLLLAVAIGLLAVALSIGAGRPASSQDGDAPAGDDTDTGTEEGGVGGAGDGGGHDDPALVERGRRLYVTGCSSCHLLDGSGLPEVPSLEDTGRAATDFYLSTGRMPMSTTSDQAQRKPPAYDEDEIEALVAFVATLGDGPDNPEVDVGAGDLQLGNSLYATNCASCHNSAGSGGALGQGIFAPELFDATPLQTAQAIRVGPGAMPVFGEAILDQHELNSIVRYVEHLKEPDDRGGAPLGRVGPVPEGLVAWVIGLGLLLLTALWIGTRERHGAAS